MLLSYTFFSDAILVDSSIEILEILRLYFKLGLKADEPVCRICIVKGNKTMSDVLLKTNSSILKVVTSKIILDNHQLLEK